MYTIFVGQKPIILTTKIEKEINYKTFLLKSVNIGKVIKLLVSTDLKGVCLVDKHKDKLLKLFLNLLPNVVAGGGKVYNDKKEVLFIYRNNKWDLPKGKIENNETIENTSIREVEEETGVNGLRITKPLPTTYHIFKRNGKHKIKITYWFEMETKYNGKLYPQIKEGITKVEWLNEKASLEALENSYANIKLLM
ncbi:MAG: NUDIX domain-containing protein [Winogradskyella sp.]|uniref:NUDIX hydrolase n=1 Tax=Winogradskyella sp. TaxID=1883156 RepID=UPI0025D55650|nr:NUDIX domain-containing protein [Winogradskyella sp.]NRB58426.1 NUDIX domain-containing protein [Winogradskyella sp.]